MKRTTLLLTVLLLGTLAAAPAARAEEPTSDVIIEIATVTLLDGVTYGEFTPIDTAVRTEHVAKQPGFLAREAAAGENGEWLVIVWWRSIEDAEASMASFATAPAAKAFMEKIDPSTLSMKRYRSRGKF